MLIVSLIRHGSTAWNEAGRMQGRRDVPLGSAGRRDVGRWAMPRTDDAPLEWVSSPLSRAVETARAVTGTSPRVAPALIEMDWGAWEGHRLADLAARFGDAFVANERRGLDFRPPGGESPRDVIARITPWLASVARSGRPVVAVTHNGVLRAALALATGWDMLGKPPVRLQPACLHRFAVNYDGALTMLEYNVPLVCSDGAAAQTPHGTQLAAP